MGADSQEVDDTQSESSDEGRGAQVTASSPSLVPAKRRRRPLFYVLAVLLGLSPFVVLELSLRLLGVEADAATTDLHDGFDEDMRLFQPDGDDLLTTDIGRERFFVKQTFPTVKPPDEFRIFVLGGSTVQGRPYLPDTSFGSWLQHELNLADSGRTYRVINCGGISYASFRLRPIVSEVLTYDPDLIVVATGHNEFLEDRTYAELKSRSAVRMWVENQARSLRTVMLLRRLTGGAARVEPTTETAAAPKEIQTRLDDPAGYASYQRDDVWEAGVVAQFADSLEIMDEACRAAAVPLMLVKLGGNLRDCPPFKSEHRADLSVEDQQQWQDLFDRGTLEDDTDPQAAITTYEQALQLDDQFALLHFRLGRCFDQTGDFAAAKTHYQSACDLDVCPLRMKTALAERLTAIAADRDIPLLDAAAVVTASADEGICGFESYIDHVHPTIYAHQRIASALAERLVQQQLVPARRVATVQQRRVFSRDLMTELGDIYFANGRRRIGWLEGWAQRKRLQQELDPVDLRGFVAAASRNVDLHRFEDAESDLAAALDLNADPTVVENLARRLFASGRNLDAKWLLSMLAARFEGQPLPDGIAAGMLAVAVDENDEAALAAAAENPAWQGRALADVLKEDTTGWGAAFGAAGSERAGER